MSENTPDLSQFDDEFANADIDAQQYDEPPDGKYHVRVERVELTTAKRSGQPMLKWQLDILGPQCVGRKLFRQNMIASAQNVKWLKTDLAMCGLDVSSMRLSDLGGRLHMLLDRVLEVRKKTTKKAGGDEFANVYIEKLIGTDAPKPIADNVDDDIPF